MQANKEQRLRELAMLVESGKIKLSVPAQKALDTYYDSLHSLSYAVTALNSKGE